MGALTIPRESVRSARMLRVARRRVRQFHTAALVRSNARVDARLRELCPNDASWQLLERLSPFDRRHALAVYDWLSARGVADSDLLQAGLLHDVGKADERTRVRLLHRVGLVVGRWFAPVWLARHWTPPHDKRLLHGLYLARNHASLGAISAARAGASQRCCALIAAHDHPGPHSDQQLQLLCLADERA